MTREQEMCIEAIEGRVAIPDYYRSEPARDDITYLLARVATLAAKTPCDGHVWSKPRHVCWKCKETMEPDATNAQRDARLVRAGVSMAATLLEKGVLVELPSPDDGPFTQQDKTIVECASVIRALATDDAAIQAPVEE